MHYNFKNVLVERLPIGRTPTDLSKFLLQKNYIFVIIVEGVPTPGSF